MRPGLVQLEIGVQSANPQTLRSVHRNPELSAIKDCVERIRRNKNVHIHLDLIAGLPYEDLDSFARSFNQVYSMHPSQLQLGFLKVLKGSPMETDAPKYGVVYKTNAPYEVLSTSWISYDEILRLKRIEEMVELYYNSSQFTATLSVLEKEFETPFEMFEELAEFYKSNGYFTNSPSRSYRYQVLLDFASGRAPERKELYQELLTFDLYFRENLKSEPAFAPDQGKYKNIIRSMDLDRSLYARAFRYPVHLAGSPEFFDSLVDRNKALLYIIVFDYSERDPLDNNASIQVASYAQQL